MRPVQTSTPGLPPPPRSPDESRRVYLACVAGLAGIFGYFLVYLYHHESKDYPTHLGDFRTAYQAAQFALQHRDIFQAGPYPDQRYIYPPLIAVAYTPLTVLHELPAAHVMLVINTTMLLASVLLVAGAMVRRTGAATSSAARPAAVCAVALLATVLGENEMRAELTMLETNALMLLMFALALWWLDRRPTWAGLALALALNVKYLPIVAVPYLVVRRRWKVLAAMAAGAVFFALIPAVVLGWHENLRCLRVALGGLLGSVGAAPEQVQTSHAAHAAHAAHDIRVRGIAADLSVSVPSMLARVLGPYGLSGPAAMALAAVVGLLALGCVALLYRANRFPLWRWPAARRQAQPPYEGLVAVEWAGLIAVMLVFSPQTNMRHLVFTAMVNTLAAVVLLIPRPAVNRLPALVAVVLIFLSYVMPFSKEGDTMRHFYFRYGIPGWCLLVGYLLILDRALRYLSAGRRAATADAFPGAA